MGVGNSSWTYSYSNNSHTFTMDASDVVNGMYDEATQELDPNRQYEIYACVYSESGYDGIAVATDAVSGSISDLNNDSDVLIVASGNGDDHTITHTTGSDGGTLYIYFITDSSVLEDDCSGWVTIRDIGPASGGGGGGDDPGGGGNATNAWVYTNEGNGNHSFEISVDEVRHTYYDTLNVTANHRYRIIVSADAENGCDGVLVTSGPHSGYEQYNNAVNWSDVIVCTTGHNGYASETYDAPSNGTLYIVFSSDNNTLNPNPSYGGVSIYDEGVITPSDVTITLNKNGGSGGQSSITATPGLRSWGASTLPSRSGFEFLGYFDSSGDQYLDDDGDAVEDAPSSDMTLYAHWKNTISYSLSVNSVTVYCTDDPIVANSVLSDQTTTISNYGYDCATGSVSYNITGSGSGYLSLEDNGETLLVESGMSSGVTRQITIELTSPSGGSLGSGSYEGDTMSVSFTLYIMNTHIDDYDSPVISVPSRYVTLDADGDAYTIDPSFTQTANWNNGATSTIVSGGSFSFSVDTACSGFSLDDDEVTVTANPTSSTRGDFIVTITCTANGESSTYDVYFDQEGGTIITYGEVEITSVYEYQWFYASGETQGPENTITYRQAKYINGTFDSYITSGADVTFHTTGTLPSGFSVESDFETSGEVTWDDRGTVTGGDRDAKDYLYVVVELNGESTSEDCESCYQQANTATWGNPVVTYNGSDEFDAEGDMIVMNINNISITQTCTYSSGSTSTNTTITDLDYNDYITNTSSFSVSYYTSGGFKAASVTATNNVEEEVQTGCYVTIEATGQGGKTGTLEVEFTQDAGVITYGNLTISASYYYRYSTFDASGETLSPSYSVVYSLPKYANGTLVENITSGATITYHTSGSLPSGFSTASNFSTTGRVTWADRGTDTGAARDASSNLYVQVSLNGKTATDNCLGCEQEANNVTYGTPVVTYEGENTFDADGGLIVLDISNISITQSCSYTSGSTSTNTTITDLDYDEDGTVNGFSISYGGGSHAQMHGYITAENNTSTSARGGYDVIISATGLGSETGTCTVTFSQAAGAREYANPSITKFLYADFGANGGTKQPTVEYSQAWTWNGVSGSGGTITTGGTLAFTTTGTLPTGFSTGTNFATTGNATWAARGTTIGDARDAKSNLRVSVTLNGKTSSVYTCTSCKQVANALTNLTIEVGSNPISYNSTTTATVTATYTSGATLNVSNDSGTTYSTNPNDIITITK